MLKSIYGFDPDFFKSGMAIAIEDKNDVSRGRLMMSFSGDFHDKNLTGNYLVRQCYITELWLTDVYGK